MLTPSSSLRSSRKSIVLPAAALLALDRKRDGGAGRRAAPQLDFDAEPLVEEQGEIMRVGAGPGRADHPLLLRLAQLVEVLVGQVVADREDRRLVRRRADPG